MSVKKSDTSAVIHGRFTYLHAWQPRKATETSKPKYSTGLYIPKTTDDGKKAKTIIDQCVEAAIKIAIGKLAKWNGQRPVKLKMTYLIDCDDPNEFDLKKNPEGKGHWCLKASSEDRPSVVDKDGVRIVNENTVYSGGYGCIHVGFYGYQEGSNGVSAGLNHIMWLKDGDPLGNRESADTAFEGVTHDGAAEQDEDVSEFM